MAQPCVSARVLSTSSASEARCRNIADVGIRLISWEEILLEKFRLQASRTTRTHTRASRLPGRGVVRGRVDFGRVEGRQGRRDKFPCHVSNDLKPRLRLRFSPGSRIVTWSPPLTTISRRCCFGKRESSIPLSTRGTKRKSRVTVLLSPWALSHPRLSTTTFSSSSPLPPRSPPSPLLRQTAEREAPREHRTRDWRVFLPLPPARELFTVHCLENASRISRAEPR